MRIVCPSSSSQALLGCHSTHTKSNRENHESKRRRSARIREQKQQKAEQAKKKEEKKKIHVQKHMPTINFIYVGNLLPGTKSSTLQALFGQFGSISRIIIRCSRGKTGAVTNFPRAVLTKRDRHYATIEFDDPRSAKRALVLNGANLDGLKLVVSISPADLPEVKEILQMRLDTTRQKQRLPEPPSRHQRAPKSLTRGDTERFNDYRDPSTDRHHIWGVSFAKCII